MRNPTTVADLLWRSGAPARAVLVASIRLYRAIGSGWLGGHCRFFPTCSHYAEAAIREHGAVKGSMLAAWRIARCNPYGAGGIDHIPARRRVRPPYDAISRQDVPRNEGAAA
jgi:uncharacterized protein